MRAIWRGWRPASRAPMPRWKSLSTAPSATPPLDGAERYLALRERDLAHAGFDARAFAGLAEEIRLRLLLRRIDRVGHEGPAELGKAEALRGALDRAVAATGPPKGRIG